VAEVITQMAEKLNKGEDLSGIFHWSSESPYTKYQTALVMACILGVDKNLIMKAKPDPEAAPRPMNAHLNSDKLRNIGIGRESDFKTAIREILLKNR
jgi:dTDP-4-dehydrorhamnose reductase